MRRSGTLPVLLVLLAGVSTLPIALAGSGLLYRCRVSGDVRTTCCCTGADADDAEPPGVRRPGCCEVHPGSGPAVAPDLSPDDQGTVAAVDRAGTRHVAPSSASFAARAPAHRARPPDPVDPTVCLLL